MTYSNSSLIEYTRLSPYNSGQRAHVIDRITPHCVVGQATVEYLGEWFSSNSRSASCNYGIGLDGRIGMYCKEDTCSWCSSNLNNDNRAVTIECASDDKYPYAFRDMVYQRLIELCIDICRRNGKTKLLWLADKDKSLAYEPAEDEMVLTVHRWFANTACPGDWMFARMNDLAEKVTTALNENQSTVKESNNNQSTISTSGLQAKTLATLSNVEIINTIAPLFVQDYKKTGILASVSMAQFILESGYSRTELAQNTNNCFGMKCIISNNTWAGSTWDGESKYKILTDEYNKDGSKFTIAEYFRVYSCIEDSITDHSAYLLDAKKADGSLRYAGLKNCTNYKQAIQIIIDGGYATAPQYIDNICDIIEMWGLTQYDDKKEEEKEPKSYQAIVIAEAGKTVNVRTQPNINSTLLTSIPIKTIITVLDDITYDDWVLIYYNNSKGYMMKKFLQRYTEEEEKDTSITYNIDTNDLAILKEICSKLEQLITKYQ